MTDTAARLGAALRQLRDGRMTQLELVAAIGESQSWLSRRENGETELTPSEIERLERALGVDLGSIYRLAGLVSGDGSTRLAIQEDPLLSREAKRLLLGAYDSVVAGLRGRRGGRQQAGEGVAEE